MADQEFSKKTEGWGDTSRYFDFVGDREPTVTITLAEYRDLVRTGAKHAEGMRKKDEATAEARMERDAAKKKLQALIDQLDGDGDEE